MHAPSIQPASPRPARAQWAVLVLALVVRGGVIGVRAEELAGDPDGYRALAENLLDRGVLGAGDSPSAYRPPLYPMLLVPCVRLAGAAHLATGALHLVLGLATVGLVLWLARQWDLGPYAGAAGLLVALDPILLRHSTLVMTETPAAFLAALALAALTRAGRRATARAAAAAGACLALAALCRPTFLLFLAMVVVCWPWFKRVCCEVRRPRPGRQEEAPADPVSAGKTARERPRAALVQQASALAAAGVVVLAPWALRNQWHFGRPIVSTTHGGYTLLLGNNPSFYEYLRTAPWGAVWHAAALDDEVRLARSQAGPGDEVANDRREYARAWHNIRGEPGMFVRACLVRVGRLWGLVPHQIDAAETRWNRWLRYGTGVWYLAEFVLAAAGLWAVSGRLRAEGWCWGLLLAASFTAVHTLYWSDLRMRAPLVPYVALLAAAGAGRILTSDPIRKVFSKQRLQ